MAPDRVGRYQIAGELGRGGMAVVYRGTDPVIMRSAALKVIRKADLDPGEGPSILDRFKREAQAAGSLQHPNIVGIYEYGEDDEYVWIAMELVEAARCGTISSMDGDRIWPGCLPSSSSCSKRSTTRTPMASCIATSSPETS